MNIHRLALITLCILAAGASHAARTVAPAPLPNCGSSPECGEWRSAVQALNDLGSGMGGGDIEPKPRNKQSAINACISYQVRVKKMSRPDAQSYCAANAVKDDL